MVDHVSSHLTAAEGQQRQQLVGTGTQQVPGDVLVAGRQVTGQRDVLPHLDPRDRAENR